MLDVKWLRQSWRLRRNLGIGLADAVRECLVDLMVFSCFCALGCECMAMGETGVCVDEVG